MLNFLLETFRLGLKNLRLHKLRSLLTALGIIFGVAAVIIMVSIGEGTKQAAVEQIRQLGATNILLRSIAPPESNDATGKTQRVLDFGLRRLDVERLKNIPGVAYMVPMRNTEQRVQIGDKRVAANAIGTTPNIFPMINLRLARGQYFTWLQYEANEQVVVLGAVAARQLFPLRDPIGETIQVGTSGMGNVLLTVIGVLEPTGLRANADKAGITNRDIDQDIYFPLSVARRIFGDTITNRKPGSMERKQIELSEIWLRANSVEDVERIASQAENVVRIQHPNLDDVTVKAPIEILRNAENINRMFNFVMVGIAAFSLVVGGIGIMNIMLATVTERTKEIGIRRALGAKQRHITLQFLIETTVISLSGGLLGIGLGGGFAKALPIVAAAAGSQYPTVITTWSVVGSFVVSGMIGIGFGLYPAIMAARMNPIEALRHE